VLFFDGEHFSWSFFRCLMDVMISCPLQPSHGTVVPILDMPVHSAVRTIIPVPFDFYGNGCGQTGEMYGQRNSYWKYTI